MAASREVDTSLLDGQNQAAEICDSSLSLVPAKSAVYASDSAVNPEVTSNQDVNAEPYEQNASFTINDVKYASKFFGIQSQPAQEQNDQTSSSGTFTTKPGKDKNWFLIAAKTAPKYPVSPSSSWMISEENVSLSANFVKYSKKAMLTEHMKSHAWSLTYKYENCDENAAQERNVQSFARYTFLTQPSTDDLKSFSLKVESASLSRKSMLSSWMIPDENFFPVGNCFKYNRKAMLSQHMKSHSWSATYKSQNWGKTFNLYACTVCKMVFRNKAVLKYHSVRCHTKGQSHSCIFCNKRYSEEAVLPQHTKCHKWKPAYKCESCGESFCFQSSLFKHKLLHSDTHSHDLSNTSDNGKQLFTCLFCDKKFSEKAMMSQHMKSHKWKPTYNCESCGESFNFQSSLFKHKLQHSDVLSLVPTDINENGEQLFSCLFCNKKYRKKALLSQHMKSHEWRAAYKCETCGEAFNFHSSLLKHRLLHSGTQSHVLSSTSDDGKQLFSCSICDKKYAERAVMSQHMKSHRRKSAYNCENNGEIINYQSSLVPSSTSDDGKQMFSCIFCSKMYTEKSMMSQHMRSHRWKPTYKCESCGEIFNFQSSLFKHKSLHSDAHSHILSSTSDNGKQLFSCFFCDKTYAERAMMSQHMKSHSRKPAYKCESCGESFCFQSSLIKHKLMHSDADNRACPSIA